jgi:N6-L-threonylcarbamoyladenine synthase
MDAAALDPQVVADMAAGVQDAIIDCLAGKAVLALDRTGFSRLCVGGGVAANRQFRQRLERLAAERGFELFVPPVALCTDNAVMGAIAVERLNAGQIATLDLDIVAGLERPAEAGKQQSPQGPARPASALTTSPPSDNRP